MPTRRVGCKFYVFISGAVTEFDSGVIPVLYLNGLNLAPWDWPETLPHSNSKIIPEGSLPTST